MPLFEMQTSLILAYYEVKPNAEVQTVNSSRNRMFVLFDLLLSKLMLSLGIHSFN